MSSSESNQGRESLINAAGIDWLSVQSLIREFSANAHPALCFVDCIYENRILRVKTDDLLELNVTLTEEDWEQCYAFAAEASIVGSIEFIPHWLKEPIDGVFSSSTCLVATPIEDENGLARGFLYAFFSGGKPSDITTHYQRALSVRCSMMLNQWNFIQRHRLQDERMWKSVESSCPAFLLIDARDGITDFGSIYRKAIPELIRGSKFAEFFAWDNLKSNHDLWSGSIPRNKLLFFHSLHHNQKYKCSVQPVSDDLLLLLAAPVVNSNHALVDYNLTSMDFSPQDYITDFVFLQTTTVKTLEDTLGQNEVIQFRNAELEMQNQELQRLKLLLEKKVEERNDRVKRLSNFPEQNPNPVFEIDFKKQFLSFSNKAAKSALGDMLTLPYDEFLGMLDLNHDVVANGLKLRVEFAVQGKTYQADAFRIPNESIMRFYAHDITDLHAAKVLLAKQQKGIEQLLAILEALNVDKQEVSKSTQVSQLMEEVTKLLSNETTGK